MRLQACDLVLQLLDLLPVLQLRRAELISEGLDTSVCALASFQQPVLLSEAGDGHIELISLACLLVLFPVQLPDLPTVEEK